MRGAGQPGGKLGLTLAKAPARTLVKKCTQLRPRLMSEHHERTLTLHDQLSLKIHTSKCAARTNFGKQIDVLRAATARLRAGKASGEH